MFDNFSPYSQKAVDYATRLASRSGGILGTEHLLAGILKVRTEGALVLENLGIQSSLLEAYIKPNQSRVSSIEISENSAMVVKKATLLAKQLNSQLVQPEHLLLAILDTPSLATSFLMANGINPRELYVSLIEMLQNSGEGNMENDDNDDDSEEKEMSEDDFLQDLFGKIKESGGISNLNNMSRKESGDKVKGGKLAQALKGIGTDLTERAREDKLDPVIGRKKEIERIIQILSRRTKNNPVLIGEPGVGKTAIVEGLAQAIVSGNVPETLKNKKIFTLDITGVVAGTKYRGEFEEKLKKAVDAIKEAGDIIVFIDEIHMLVGAGAGSDSSMDAANILKPMLARGEMQTIGATTLDEYRKNIEKDAALERRFQPIVVDPPSVEDTILILKGLRKKYEDHHKVKITDEALTAAAELSDRYISDRFLPDKAVDLIDEASSRKRMRNYTAPDFITEMEGKIAALEQEINENAKQENYSKAAMLKKEKDNLIMQLSRSKLDWSSEVSTVQLQITEQDIAEIVSSWTSIPVVKLTEAESDKLMRLEEELGRRVVGQKEALSALSRAIRRARAGLSDPKRPIGSFIFMGPTGVGKTELCKALAEVMFGDENLMVRIDMSEYMDKISATKLTGSAPGYVGYDEGGQLTEKIRRKPYSVVLFDEIEKAHPDIYNILLQIMEDGRLTDSHGRVVSFKNTIIIMTSNIGANAGGHTKKLGFGTADEYENMREAQIDQLKKAMRPEFINRLDDIIVFHSLSAEDIANIAEIMINGLKKRLEIKNIKILLTDEAKKYIISKGTNVEYGARPLRRTLQKLLEDALSEKILSAEVAIGDEVTVDYKEGEALVFTSGGAAH